MKTHAVLSVLGRDKVGAADDLAVMLAKRGLEIKQSRMAVLGGQFAMLVQVSADADCVTDLRRDLADLSGTLGFHLQLASPEFADRAQQALRVAPPLTAVEVVIESYSSEPSGLNAITGILKRRHVNIEALETEVSSEPCTSRMTFHTTARVKVPGSCPVERLEEELHELASDLNSDILVKPIPELVAT